MKTHTTPETQKSDSADGIRKRLDNLDKRLAAAHIDARPSPSKIEHHHAQAHVAWRMLTELVSGLVIGFGIGYGLDMLVGTAPWMMLVMTLAGLAAGMKTMLATARQIGQETRQIGHEPQTAARKAPGMANREY